MSGADLLEDGFPHGTREGYERGCRGAACPGREEFGLTCEQARTRYAGDFGYRRLVDAGKSPVEIVAADRVRQEQDRAAARRQEATVVEEKSKVKPVARPKLPAPVPVPEVPDYVLAAVELPADERERLEQERDEGRHGTYAGYIKGCRLGPQCPSKLLGGMSCLDASNAYSRDLARRKREARESKAEREAEAAAVLAGELAPGGEASEAGADAVPEESPSAAEPVSVPVSDERAVTVDLGPVVSAVPPVTRWNGLPTPAAQGRAVVAANPRFPKYWAKDLIGQRIRVCAVVLDGVASGGGVLFLDDRSGRGWAKVTTGGSAGFAHSEVAIVPGSFEPFYDGEATDAVLAAIEIEEPWPNPDPKPDPDPEPEPTTTEASPSVTSAPQSAFVEESRSLMDRAAERAVGKPVAQLAEALVRPVRVDVGPRAAAQVAVEPTASGGVEIALEGSSEPVRIDLRFFDGRVAAATVTVGSGS